MPEVAVIGAGPAGTLAATPISLNGFKVKVYEEHPRIGEPCHCAGIISVEGLKRLNIEPNDEFIQNTVYGGRAYSPAGEFIEIRDRKPRAYIIDRARLDKYLAEKAMDAGVEYNLSSRVDELRFKDHTCVGLNVKGEQVEADLVINAEGAGGRVLSRSGIDTKQNGLLTGFNVELDGVDVDQDIVEVWFSERRAKGLFAWVVPLTEGRVRCGLATSGKNGLESLRNFIRGRFNVTDPTAVHGGVVCTGGPIRKTVYDGLMIVGDAAGQVKATTGGGVVIGGLCALKAGEIASDAINDGNTSWGKLHKYEREWRDLYGFELKTMHATRRLMNNVGDERMNRIIRGFKDEDLEDAFVSLVEEGDMDMQADVIKRALTTPSILAVLARSLGRVALSELLSVLG
ncbi:MAG: NAD(P)/FAD-dependent oxidoreductase [Candidatus Bathyarchaeota archaeon]|nr:NAD(P)/FAD-dependent oxidoreductase [Candidatus Bathyarchaeota archaeon]